MPDRRITFPRVLAIMAVGMAIGFGTCSAAALITNGSNAPLITIGAILFFTCFAGIVVTVLVWLIVRIINGSRS